jgi:hypothetical protein
MTGFRVPMAADPIVAQIANPISMAVKNTALGFPSACSIASHKAHLGETRLAELAIDDAEGCQHDRTPLLINTRQAGG